MDETARLPAQEHVLERHKSDSRAQLDGDKSGDECLRFGPVSREMPPTISRSGTGFSRTARSV